MAANAWQIYKKNLSVKYFIMVKFLLQLLLKFAIFKVRLLSGKKFCNAEISEN